MAHGITTLDKGFVHGATWHGREEYRVIPDDTPITIDNALECVDYEIKTVPTYTSTEIGNVPTGGFCAVRMDQTPPVVLAPNLGNRFTILPRKALLSVFQENLLAEFPQLAIAGVGTLDGGAGFWLQLMAEKYVIAGDQSPHELRLCYSENLGETTHQVFCSHVRIECQNTLRAAWGDALARKIFAKHRHTRGAEAKIHATADSFAELHLHLEREKTELEALAARPVKDEAEKLAILDRLIPVPVEGDKDYTTRAHNAAVEARNTFQTVFEDQRTSMDSATAWSYYGMLQAYTNWADHASKTRNAFDREQSALYGPLSVKKMDAKATLLDMIAGA